MSPAPLLVVKTGTTVPAVRERRGDFEDFFRAGLGLDGAAVVVVEPPAGQELPDPASVAGVVVTGSSAMVTDEPGWSVATGRWLARAVEAGRPVLAVCYGHQLLAHALGGEVGWNQAGREIGTVSVDLLADAAEDALLGGLRGPLTVQASHSQSVLRLPPGAAHLARNAHDPHQAFRVGARAWGVQFHPEFDADIVRGYVEDRREALREEGIDPARRLADVRDDPVGRELLRRFAALALRRAAPRGP